MEVDNYQSDSEPNDFLDEFDAEYSRQAKRFKQNENKLKVQSLLYYPGDYDELLEDRPIGIFPRFLLHEYSNNIGNASEPLTFSLTSDIINVYVIAYDYSSSNDTIYLPQYLLDNCFIGHDETVNVKREVLEKITKIDLKPIHNKFAEETSTPKEILEKEIVQKYPILSLNDTININGHELYIKNIEPNITVSTIDSDPTVEFLQSFEEDDIELKKEQQYRDELERELEDKLHINFPGKGQSISGNITREYASIKKETKKTTNLAGKSRLI